MKLERIFGPKRSPTKEGLYALVQDGEKTDEWRKLIRLWTNSEKMLPWCKQNLQDLQHAFGYPITAVNAADCIMEEAEELFKLIYELGTQQRPDQSLQHLFKPLNNQEAMFAELQLSKGLVKTSVRRSPKLRLYAVRIGPGTYVITGGAIKLTHLMEERPHTVQELMKLKRTKDWLKEERIAFPEDLGDLT